MIGSMITYGFSKDRNQLHYEYDKSFNPIRMWHKNQDKYGDISGYIRQGMFNDVPLAKNPDHSGQRPELVMATGLELQRRCI